MLPQRRMPKSLRRCHDGHICTIPPRCSMHLPSSKVSLDNSSSCKLCLHCRALTSWGRLHQPSGTVHDCGTDDPSYVWGHAQNSHGSPTSISARATGSLDTQTKLQAPGISDGVRHGRWCSGMVSAQVKHLHGPEPQKIVWKSNISSSL